MQRSPTNTTKAKNSARHGRVDQALQRMGLKPFKKTRVRPAAQCVVYSHGQVRDFFVRNPCGSLHRQLLAATDAQGSVIVVSVVWVRLARADSARQFISLIDVYGTGDIAPLGSELLGLEGVQFTGRFYDSDRIGPSAVIAETEAATGDPDPQLLKAIAEVATHFPRPR